MTTHFWLWIQTGESLGLDPVHLLVSSAKKYGKVYLKYSNSNNIVIVGLSNSN